MSDDRIDHEAWPLRAVILLALGALFGLAFDSLVTTRPSYGWSWTDDPLRLAGATFVAVSGFGFAFTLERRRWLWSLLFALACGLVAGSVTYWNGASDSWRFASMLLAIGIAAPLFQVVRDEGRWRLAQRPIHAHAWTNAVLWCAAWLFVLIVYLLVLLLGQLFNLIGIDFLKELLRKSWFNWILVGAALGAAVGLLRDRDKVLGLLQRVVTIILSMLTPILAIGLGLFILSLPFTGLAPLWRETSATTPILLSCAAIAVLFTNATIGNAADEEPRLKALLHAGLILALTILPLALVAAISTGLRIGQHGFTPDRLWAGVCIAIALVYGLAYLAALALGRWRWPDCVRQMNVWLALGLCGLALLLGTPLISFGAISTRDQVSRLESGRLSPDQFDWRALAFDFGPSGRRALEKLHRQSKSEVVRREAGKVLIAKSRWSVDSAEERLRRRTALAQLRVVPRPVPLPTALKDRLSRIYFCSNGEPCTLYYERDANWAVAISQPPCIVRHSPERGKNRQIEVRWVEPGTNKGPCDVDMTVLYRVGDAWRDMPDRVRPSADSTGPDDQAWQNGEIEIREVSRRQVFVGGEPVGDAFE